MSYRALIADDYEDMRELLSFVFTSQLGFRVELASSGNEAIDLLKKDSSFDVIVTDLNMPNGNGVDLFKHYSGCKFSMPFFVISGDLPSQHPSLTGPTVTWMNKPFDVKALVSKVKTFTDELESVEQYFSVSISFLKKMKRIEIPLFVKINDQKYVQMTRDQTDFTDEEYTKYKARHLETFYIESHRVDEFLSTYRRRVVSLDSWQEAGQAHEVIALDSEVIKNIGVQFGWEEKTRELVKDSLKRALLITQKNQEFSGLMDKFKKIEKFGLAEHCTITLHTSIEILNELGYADEISRVKMTFATLLHDAVLDDQDYSRKADLIKKGVRFSQNAKDSQKIFEHPVLAASICEKWDFCPPEVEEIIKAHHEKPDGSGFPFGKKASDFSFLTCVFILAEDLTDYYVHNRDHLDFKKFLSDRSDIYDNGHLASAFRALSSILAKIV